MKNGAKANLKGGASTTEIVNFKGAKNSDVGNIRADIRDGPSTKKMIDLRGTMIVGGTNIA